MKCYRRAASTACARAPSCSEFEFSLNIQVNIHRVYIYKLVRRAVCVRRILSLIRLVGLVFNDKRPQFCANARLPCGLSSPLLGLSGVFQWEYEDLKQMMDVGELCRLLSKCVCLCFAKCFRFFFATRRKRDVFYFHARNKMHLRRSRRRPLPSKQYHR